MSLSPLPHIRVVFCYCCCNITFFCYCVNVCAFFVNFFIVFFFWVQRVYWCADCVLFYCVCNYALLLCCCCCCCFLLCVFLCCERVIEFRWENMPKNGTKYALVLVFFVGVTVCVCVCGWVWYWVCKLILVILIDLLQAGFCFLAIKKSHKQNCNSRQKANDLSWQRQRQWLRSWRRRKCGQAAVFVSLCVRVCVCVQSKRQNWKNQAQDVHVCVCIYLLLRRMAHSKSEISTWISL